MSRVLLAVDLSNQAYKASAAFSGLTSSGRFTGGLYGFLVGLQKAITAVGATDLVICEDRKPYLRSKLYPEYKAARKESRDPELYERAQFSIGLIKELLQVTGWPLWALPGFESDDLIAHAVTKYRHRFRKIVAMSNDSDLYLLFQYPVFQVYKGKNGIYDRQQYDKEWLGLPPDLFRMALAFTGTHNEVEGVRGIGPVTARAIVTNPYKLRLAREQHREVVERNLQLIQLPHPDFPRSEPIPKYTRRFTERDLLRFCGRFDITLTREMCVAFEQIGTQ